MKDKMIQIGFEAEKLEALIYYMEKKELSIDAELSETIQKLYEKHVPQATRDYIDDRLNRTEKKKVAKKKTSESPISAQSLQDSFK